MFDEVWKKYNAVYVSYFLIESNVELSHRFSQTFN